jgi:vitamin B12/bleomycin/antimicrobial peptide transport system ATP-binding/permease protein
MDKAIEVAKALFWATGFGYWRLGGERSAWVLTGGLFALILLNLGIAYEMNVWNRAMFDALQQRDSTTVLLQGIIFFLLWRLASAWAYWACMRA